MKEELLSVLEDGAILTLSLAGLFWLSTLSLPFALSWALAYMVTRAIFDTLRRRGGRWAILIGVAGIIGVLTVAHARNLERDARAMEALIAWQQADARAAEACAGARLGSEACVMAVEAERAAALRLCDLSGGTLCP